MENYSKPLRFPDDVTRKILICLPPKSLLRFTVVSKSWQDLIQSHEFIHSHIKHNSKKRTQLIFSSESEKYPSSEKTVHDDLNCTTEVAELKSTILSAAPLHLGKHQVIGHCNGIICLATKIRGRAAILLWNPALRQCRRVPSSFLPIGMAGFWYDCKNQDYQIILCSTSHKIYRYSLKTDTWRHSCTKSTFGFPSDCLCFDGMLHWTIRCQVIRHAWSLIIYNLAEDKIRRVAMPRKSPDEITGPNLGVFRGRLSFVRRRLYLMREEFEIWSTADPITPRSWMKVLSISPMRLSMKTPFLRTLGLDGWMAGSVGLTSDGKVLVALSHFPVKNTLLRHATGDMMHVLEGDEVMLALKNRSNPVECALLYDAETHKLEVYKYSSDDDAERRWFAITDYVESLVSVHPKPWWGKFLLSGQVVGFKLFAGFLVGIFVFLSFPLLIYAFVEGRTLRPGT